MSRSAAHGEPPTTDFMLLTPVPTEVGLATDVAKAFPGFRLIESVEAGPRGTVVRAADPAGRLYLVRLVKADPATVVAGGRNPARWSGPSPGSGARKS